LFDHTYVIEKEKLSKDIKEMRRELMRMDEIKYQFLREIDITQ